MRSHVIPVMGLWSLSGWSVPAVLEDTPERHAVVDINDYTDLAIPGLQHAEADALESESRR